MHKSWGRSPILVTTLSLCFYQNFVWLFTRLCFWKIILFFLVPCAIMKSVEGLVICWNFAFLWELVISFFYHYFTFLNEINVWACVFWFSLCSLVFWSSCVELLYQSCVDLVLWYNLNNFCSATLWCAFLIFLVFCSNYISFWFLKVLCMHIYYMYILWHACFLWSNI